ncbi:hypothetical protein B0H19DRAFT_1162614 [Mycena capillaripes]|nr:hypothetical protein B0H19DRAFT_1162614 [Mycena capillaripes]
MSDCPPTPIVTRRPRRLSSYPHIHFNTDFRTFSPQYTKDSSNENSSEVPQTPKCPSFRPAVSLEIPEENDVPSSPVLPVSSLTHARLPSPSYIPRYTSNLRIVPLESIEEHEHEDDDEDGCPPISSSPGRSSDPFFPSNEAFSSPHTSEYGSQSPEAHILGSRASPDKTDFSSRLHALLIVAAQHRERHKEIDNDFAATLVDRSLSVTPDYPASLTPCDGNDTFGPRTARRTYSWSTFSPDSADFRSCKGSDCDRFRSATRTASIASTSGYAADLDGSPAHAPQVSSSSHTAAFMNKFRDSNSTTPTQRRIIDTSSCVATSTQRLLTDSSNFVAPLPHHSLKRARSSIPNDITPTQNHKKFKPMSRCSSSSSRSKTETSDNTTISHIPASLRKSLSLRSDASNRSPSPLSDDFFPTAPNTPSSNTGRVIDFALLPIPFDVPIIAPPPEHMARLPLSKETSAKIRIGNFLAREEVVRAADKLDGMTVAGVVATLHAGDDDEERELERLKWEHILGIGSELREHIVEWILEVLPKKSYYISPRPRISTASRYFSPVVSDASSSFSSADDFGHRGMPDLIDQLLHSPETRFHAAYMFVRFFCILMRSRESRTKIESMQQAAEAAENDMSYDPAIPPEGWYLVAWDSCLACLAISVKAHRDVLEPLNPIMSWEFEALAKHEVSFQDLEIAQQDVLAVFGYRLGGTPQPILDELWIALPSLRQLLEFKNGWKFAQKETWWRLFDAVAAPDVLKFPISLLTVAALAEALVAALVSKYEYDATIDSQVTRRCPSRCSDSKKFFEKLEIKAEKEMEGVVQDIQAIVGISDHTLKTCRSWIRASLK